MNSLSTLRKLLFGLITLALSSAIVLGVGEGMARMAEDTEQWHGTYTIAPDPTLGWIPKPNTQGGTRTREYDATYQINELSLNDSPLQSHDHQAFRILVIGDSHTFALGVDMAEAWPNQMEQTLGQQQKNRIIVYNGGVIGYSLGQYLNRLKILDAELNADAIVIGFSMATDLYDLIPPERGGFVYGSNAPRVYYDLDKSGQLIEKNSSHQNLNPQKNSTNNIQSDIFSVRKILQHFALYRVLKRSKLAFWIAAHYQPGGKSLWPGLDTALKITLSPDDQYRWGLAEALIAQMAEYAHSQNKQIFLVNIPYLAQIYDEIWTASFGQLPEKYDRMIGGQRLKNICARYNINYIDTTNAFINSTKQSGEWLHFRQDGHPTPAGHSLIADTVATHLVKKTGAQSLSQSQSP